MLPALCGVLSHPDRYAVLKHQGELSIVDIASAPSSTRSFNDTRRKRSHFRIHTRTHPSTSLSLCFAVASAFAILGCTTAANAQLVRLDRPAAEEPAVINVAKRTKYQRACASGACSGYRDRRWGPPKPRPASNQRTTIKPRDFPADAARSSIAIDVPASRELSRKQIAVLTGSTGTRLSSFDYRKEIHHALERIAAKDTTIDQSSFTSRFIASPFRSPRPSGSPDATNGIEELYARVFKGERAERSRSCVWGHPA